MTIGPTIWQTPIDPSQRSDIYQPEDPNGNIHSNSATGSPPDETRGRVAKTTHSNSTVLSLTSDSSGSPASLPIKHSRPKTIKLQDSKPTRKKQNMIMIIPSVPLSKCEFH